MNKMMIKTVSETEARVTKAFQKKAMIFGSPEYKLWREYLKEFPGAQMVVSGKSGAARNMTYKNMIAYIKVQKNADAIQKEFERRMEMAKPQKSPYKYMVDWFKNTFPHYADSELFKTDPNETSSEENNAN